MCVCLPMYVGEIENFIFKDNTTDSGFDQCMCVVGKMYALLTILSTLSTLHLWLQELFEKPVVICSYLSLFGMKSLLPRKN